jgi:CRP-like cAMP-binding protein
MANPKVHALKSAPLFEGLADRQLDELARVVDEMDAVPGKALANEGAIGHEFFVLLEGQAAVTQGGREIGLLGPGDFFGEIALLEDVPRTATVTATTAVRFFVLTRQAFRGVTARYPDVEAKVRAAVEQRRD